MEPIRYTTKITGNEIVLPDEIVRKIDPDTEIEIVFRSLSICKEPSKDLNQVIDDITESMNKKYPNLGLKVNKQLQAVAGISSDINKKLAKFSDKEIKSIARMEKYMEKEEILENLY